MLRRIIVNMTFKTILAKSIGFLIPWSIIFLLLLKFYPEFIDMNKLITNIMSNTFVFYICYVLTVIGFQYSSKDSKNE